MVIVSDAAHAPSPSAGQGAPMAAEDAVVLAKCLRDLLLEVVFKLLVTDRSLAWMYDHHIDWDTPTRQSDPALP
jgi:2-polyprenyl-6-methoxyphenol hydroxylase-like FAD-dependent oxidoreductase